MAFFYNLGIRAYTAAIRLASPFNEKAALWTQGRKDIRNRIKAVSREAGRLIWFHAASLGEFEQGRPVIEALKQQQPDTKILLTFFSPSGYEIRKNYKEADYIFYLPADTPANARLLISRFKPDAAVFIKYEFWYNYLHELHRQHIPVYLISAVFRPAQAFFKPWGGLQRKMLHCFTRLFVQDAESVRLLASVGISCAEQTGDTRFDRVKQIAGQSRNIETAEAFLNGAPAVVCGSTWLPDEELLLSYINDYRGTYKWIVVPHEIGESHIRSILEKCHKKTARYSAWKTGNDSSAEVLIVDCIGLLSSLYRYGRIAYIGGGFGAGIHNTLEAAVYGIPVLFGPRFRKFREAVELSAQGGAFPVKDATELREILDVLLGDPGIARTAGEKARDYVDSRLGATDRILKYLQNR